MRFCTSSGGITVNVGRREGFTESGNTPLKARTISAWRGPEPGAGPGIPIKRGESLQRSSAGKNDTPNAATLDRSTSGATNVVFIQPLGKPDGQKHPPGRPCRRLWVAGHPIL